MAKVRFDQLLVQRGLCETRARAQARILAGDVLVDDRPVTKAGAAVAEDAPLRLRGEALPYVSRGGLKLAGGLDVFGLDPAGRVDVRKVRAQNAGVADDVGCHRLSAVRDDQAVGPLPDGEVCRSRTSRDCRQHSRGEQGKRSEPALGDGG